MKRREFLRTTTGGAIAASMGSIAGHLRADEIAPACCDRTYATPADAMKSPAEKIAYMPCIRTGTGVNKPDYLATVDVDPKSPTYSSVIHRLPMPNVGDELHHYGWNACSSCHGAEGEGRRYLVMPGITSSRIHIVDTSDPIQPKMHKVIEGEEVKQKTWPERASHGALLGRWHHHDFDAWHGRR